MTDGPAAKLLGALGLARRAGALAIGFDAVAEAARRGKARLALLASDLSPGTKRRITAACQGRCPVCSMPQTMLELAAITKKPAGVLAITNKDLAGLCLQALAACPRAHEEEPV